MKIEQPFKAGDKVLTDFHERRSTQVMIVESCRQPRPFHFCQTGWMVLAKYQNGDMLDVDSAWFEKIQLKLNVVTVIE